MKAAVKILAVLVILGVVLVISIGCLRSNREEEDIFGSIDDWRPPTVSMPSEDIAVVLAREMCGMNLRDPKADAREVASGGDLRYLAARGIAVEIPGFDQALVGYYLGGPEGYEHLRIIGGTSGMVLNSLHAQLLDLLYPYCAKYNQEMAAQRKEPALSESRGMWGEGEK